MIDYEINDKNGKVRPCLRCAIFRLGGGENEI